MSRRIPSIIALGLLLTFISACSNKKAVNPLANVGSKQPDKILFDKAMDAMRRNRFDVARLTLQTLINTYPNSEFIARAKLAVGDSWYAEGGTAALAQAEQEYSDFEIFFPNMKEAAEAQLKIANIHYQQMEKADRDYTHAKRAEDEYRKMILQYPDSKLVPEAKQKLLEVQEVLAEREFGIGRFYYLRESYPASIARLQSLVDRYPLYSRVDEALYLLGQNYEGQLARAKSIVVCDDHGQPRGCMPEKNKANYIADLTKRASNEYERIITRYPMMDRADDARKRLTSLNQPVPRPTKGAVALNKAEEASRGEATPVQRALGLVRKGPDVTQAAKVGNPTLVDPEAVTPTGIVRDETAAGFGFSDKATVQVVGTGQGATPDSAAPPNDNNTPAASPFGPANSAAQANQADPNELKPTQVDSNELKPTDNGVDPTLPPPAQVNEIAGQSSSSSATAQSDENTPASDVDISSSKKKKGLLKKIIPF